MTNGLDQEDLNGSVDLTGNDDNYDDGATTTVVPLFPGYEDSGDYDQVGTIFFGGVGLSIAVFKTGFTYPSNPPNPAL